MILRKLADAIRTQNWFTVTIEILIVVIGIFLGLQVTEWNEARWDRADEQRYLAELETDLGFALQEIDETMNNARLRKAAGAFVFEGAGQLETFASFKRMGKNFGLPRQEEANPENHLPLIFSVTRIVDKHGDAYAELVATGNIGILRDRSLVRELSRYYSRYDEIQTGDQINWEQMKLAQEAFQKQGIAMTASINPQDFIILLEQNSELDAMVKNVTALAGWQVIRLSNLRADTEAILAKVQEARQ